MGTRARSRRGDRDAETITKSLQRRGRTAATTYGTWSASSIQATVPSAATSGNLVVTVGGVASNNWSFTVTPHITSLSVTTGPRGAAVTITGTGFGATKGSSTVKFGTLTASTTSWGASSIATTVPNSAPIGSTNVVVTVDSVASNPSPFTVSPQIISLSPGQGQPESQLMIGGTGFGASQGSSTVTLNGVTATVIPDGWSDTSVNVLVPTILPSTVPVIVTVNSVASNSSNFVVTAGFTCN